MAANQEHSSTVGLITVKKSKKFFLYIVGVAFEIVINVDYLGTFWIIALWNVLEHDSTHWTQVEGGAGNSIRSCE
jgi:hypothetical protein